jgi:hypothetical protein
MTKPVTRMPGPRHVSPVRGAGRTLTRRGRYRGNELPGRALGLPFARLQELPAQPMGYMTVKADSPAGSPAGKISESQRLPWITGQARFPAFKLRPAPGR